MSAAQTVKDCIAELAHEAAGRQFDSEVSADDVNVDRALADAWFVVEIGKQSPQQLLADMVCELTDAEALALFAALTAPELETFSAVKAAAEAMRRFIATDIARDASRLASDLCEKDAASHPTRCRCRDCRAEYGDWLYEQAKDRRAEGAL